MKRLFALLLAALLFAAVFVSIPNHGEIVPFGTIASAIQNTYPVLQRGDSGNDVIPVQSRLIELGYLDDTADGKFGGHTESALIAFQEKNGLEATGIATSDVQQILFGKGAISADGIAFDAYDFSKAEATPTKAPTQKTSGSSGDYIGNKNTMKFHHSYCSSVNDMKESNKVPFDSREEAISAGYVPCKRCNP